MQKILADKIFVDGKFKSNYSFIIDNDLIKEIVPNSKDSTINYKDSIIIPGLVDTHIHGYKGIELIDANVESINQLAINLLESGVTAFVPTLQTASEKDIERAITNISLASDFKSGAKILGIFLEGPFISEKFKGAQDGRYLQNPSIDLIKKWQQISNNKIIKIAIAPELPDANQVIEYAYNNNMTVAIGHSDATAEQTQQAIQNGASVLIHTFNAMRGLHHREPGILGKSLITDSVYSEVISDGHHLHRDIVDLIIRLKGKEKTILITDGTLASGLSDGVYNRAGTKVYVNDGAVKTEEGLLAGSSLQIIQAIRNIINWKIEDLETVIPMATMNPIHSLRITELGELKKGSPADFVVLNNELEVVATYLNGKEIYRKK